MKHNPSIHATVLELRLSAGYVFSGKETVSLINDNGEWYDHSSVIGQISYNNPSLDDYRTLVVDFGDAEVNERMADVVRVAIGLRTEEAKKHFKSLAEKPETVKMKESIVRPRMTAANRDKLSAMADTLSDDRQEGIKLVIELAERSGSYLNDVKWAECMSDSLQIENKNLAVKVCELSKAHAIAENARLVAMVDYEDSQEGLKLSESFHKWYFLGGIAAGIISSLISALAFKLL